MIYLESSFVFICDFQIRNELEKELNKEKTVRMELEEGLINEKHKVEVISNENSTLKEIKKVFFFIFF